VAARLEAAARWEVAVRWEVVGPSGPAGQQG